MIQTRTIGSHTEIYSDKNGGGKSEIYITQNKATVFHNFFTRKILGEGEAVEDFKEVTEAERQTLEQSREAWVRPPQVFIDQWNVACGIWGQYNEHTGYFELNGLLDITYEEALRIMAYGAIDRYDCQGMFRDFPDIRTNLPRRSVARTDYIPQGFNVVNFGGSHTLEVLNLDTRDKVDTTGFILDVRNTYKLTPYVSDYCFYFTKCTKVIGIIDLRYQTVYLTGIWSTMRKLCEIWIRNLKADFTIPENNIKPECVRYMIENAINTQPITIGTDKKHYPKLTGDTSDPVVAAMSPEELKKWTDIVPLAAEKNITFARLNWQT